MTIYREDRDRLRRYLLGELAEADEESVELRLLVDSEFSEELDMIEDELIDHYVEDALSPEERGRLEQHFFEAPERRQKLRFVLALKSQRAPEDAEEKHKVVPLPGKARVSRLNFAWSYLKVAAIILVALGVGLGVWLLLSRPSDVDRGTEALAEAYKNQRLTEARVTALGYAPLIVPRGQEKPNINGESRDRAERLLQDAVEQRHDAKSYHALGRFYLAAQQLDKAIDYFEKALSQEQNNAETYSDMGAALLELGRQAKLRDETDEAFPLYTRSLENIDKALQLKPNLPEALFNRALCLHNMMLPEQAREAWQNYLARDPQSMWAEEARRKLQEISGRSALPPTPSQLLDEFLAAAREHDEARAWQILSRNREVITGKMIPIQLARTYVSHSLNGRDEGAQESLRAFLFAGELDRQKGGDPYTSELAAYYAASTDGQRRSLSAALEEMRAGYELCLGTRYDEATRRFTSAREMFEKAGDAWESRLADYWIAYCLTQDDRINESNALLQTVAEFCARRSYKWLHAQALGWLAVNHSILSERSDSIAYNRQSLALAEEISDTYQMQKALSGLGSQYANLQQPRLSMEYYYKSLSLASQTNTPPRQALRNFYQTAAAMFAFKHYAAAAAFTNEALHLGMSEASDPSLVYMLHLNLAQIYSKLRRFDEAVEQINLSLQVARSVQDPSAGQKITANAILKQADVWREAGDWGQAVTSYNQVISLYEKMEFNLDRYAAYKGRLLCERALGDLDGVQRDLPILLQLFESSRKQIREEQNRNSFFDTEQGVYDIAIEYERERQNDAGALDYAEKGRARSLLDALSSGVRVESTASGLDIVFPRVTTPPNIESVDSVRQSMPPQVHVLMYTVLPTKLLIWSISREHFSVHEEKINADALEADISAYLSSLAPGQATNELGSKLYDILLAPVVEEIEAGKKVCIIPDKFLHRLPFVALVSPDSGKYFAEERPIFYAPSLNVLWHCSAESERKGVARDGLVLSIGNPAFDRRAHPDLLPLEAAEREASEVANLYTHSIHLLGRKATKENTLRAMQSAEVVHFAGHYVVNNNSPLLSKMLLADGGLPTPDNRGSDLFAFEIFERRFDHTKLIVLSACQTGLDRHYEGEGAVGLSRAFLAAGVPLVVASQWPVDSAPTANLMIGFHRYRRSGLDTLEALRQAQVDMLRGPDKAYRSPYYWAAFFCAGGYAEV